MTQEEIATALRAANEPRLVETTRELERVAEAWNDCGVLGIDTEFVRERTYRADLGLVQVSNGTTAWLVDPVQIDRLDALSAMLEDPAITKVFHSSSEDLEVLWLTLGVSPAPMVDTQIACAMLGQPLQQSYHNTVKSQCGVEVDKEQTRSNWIKRPLKPEQLHYAATDVVFLPMLHRELHERLEEAGRRHWLEQDVDLMRQQSREPVDPEGAYLRIGGAGRLDQPGLRVLQRLAKWREEAAASRNRARGFVVSDPVLLQMAQIRPESREDLAAIDGLHQSVVRRDGETLLSLVREGLESSEAVAELAVLDNRDKKVLDSMRSLVRRQGESLGIDPALLASRKVLEDLIRCCRTGKPIPERLQSWRKDVVTDELVEILEKLSQ